MAERKNGPGGLGKGSGFFLSELKSSGPYNMSLCGVSPHSCKHQAVEKWDHDLALEPAWAGD